MRIGINAGHTLNGAGSGAVGILNESQETRKVVEHLNALLTNSGHTVVNCTVDKANNQNEYLAKVVEMANRQDLDYFISIHFNCADSNGRGTEVYTYEGRQFQDALEVCQNIASLGFKNRGVKDGSGLYVVKKTKAKSMLIECCFIDNQADVDLYNKIGSKGIAEAIYKALVDSNPVTEPPKPAPVPVEPPKPAIDPWVDRLNREVSNQGFNSYPTVKKGAKGNITGLIQERLNSVGFRLNVDGDFGTNTHNAVKVFQENRGLKKDGIVGANTWDWLVKGTKM